MFCTLSWVGYLCTFLPVPLHYRSWITVYPRVALGSYPSPKGAKWPGFIKGSANKEADATPTISRANHCSPWRCKTANVYRVLGRLPCQLTFAETSFELWRIVPLSLFPFHSRFGVRSKEGVQVSGFKSYVRVHFGGFHCQL